MTGWEDVFQTQEWMAGGLRLNTVAGPANGVPLAMLHGVARRWTDFAPILPQLCERHHVHALDFRGHGASGRAGGYLVVDYITDALRWVEFLCRWSGHPMVVYGHSLGAMVAIAVAAKAANAVRGIVLEDPPFHTMGRRIEQTPYYRQFIGMREVARRGGSTHELARSMADIILPGKDGRDVRLGDVRDAESLRQSAECLAVMDAEVLTPVIEGRWLDNYDKEELCREVRCPVLLLQADPQAGGALTDLDAERIAKSLRSCRRTQFSGVGHLMHWQQPDALLMRVEEFVETLTMQDDTAGQSH